MKSRVAILCELLEGAHVMGPDPLRDYHTARRVINANRKRKDLVGSRLMAVRRELKNYRVVATITEGGWDVRVYRPDTGQEWFLVGKGE